MTLHISSNKLISEIQKEFNQHFPYLKLEFFTKGNFGGSGPARKRVPNDRRIGEALYRPVTGEVAINGNMKVKDLQALLTDQFSLSAQVLRKSGNVWLETTMTEDWTLIHQNNHGMEIAAEKNPAKK